MGITEEEEMTRWRDCPCEYETPDPCPKCGATVSGNDPVNGVCQAGSWDMAEIERLQSVLREINALCHIPTKGSGFTHAYTHFQSDFDKIRKLTSDAASSVPAEGCPPGGRT